MLRDILLIGVIVFSVCVMFVHAWLDVQEAEAGREQHEKAVKALIGETSESS